MLTAAKTRDHGAGDLRKTEPADGVVFQDVAKFYGDICAVSDLNLSVTKGEFLTFLGPSGSGKTTSLLMLAGFESPTRGEIHLDGKPVHNSPAHKRNIGMVFQNYALFPHMTVGENIAFPLSVRGRSRREIEESVAHALDLVRLHGLADRRPAQLSGGQQQRVALARALVFNPSLILMDEPLGALDRQLREELQIEIKRIHAELGVTLIYVTHDQSEALTMSDRIVVFKDGRVRQVGSPSEIYERPSSAFVAQFIGESNQLPGTVVATEGRHSLVELPSGYRIRALTSGDLAIGSDATLSIRPERIVLSRDGPAFGDSVPGVVEDVIFHGDHTRVRFRAPTLSSCLLSAKAKVSRDGNSLRPGDTVGVGWELDEWRVFESLLDPSTKHKAEVNGRRE